MTYDANCTNHVSPASQTPMVQEGARRPRGFHTVLPFSTARIFASLFELSLRWWHLGIPVIESAMAAARLHWRSVSALRTFGCGKLEAPLF